jgi:hypothetical protein
MNQVVIVVKGLRSRVLAAVTTSGVAAWFAAISKCGYAAAKVLATICWMQGSGKCSWSSTCLLAWRCLADMCDFLGGLRLVVFR